MTDALTAAPTAVDLGALIGLASQMRDRAASMRVDERIALADEFLALVRDNQQMRLVDGVPTFVPCEALEQFMSDLPPSRLTGRTVDD